MDDFSKIPSVEHIPITDRQQWLGLYQRFESKFIPEPNSGCWLWTGAFVPDGYGSMFVGLDDLRYSKAHRVSWILHRGAIGGGLQVLHRCDNRACVNPDHLFIGDNAANVADRVKKGRSATGRANARWIDGRTAIRKDPIILRGELVGNSKLTAADVVSIRADATRSQRQIAEIYGVAQTLISAIKRRKVWCHVN
jgi:hypothetical protein